MKFRILALVVGAASLLMASSAQANPALSIVWRTSGTSSTSATATNNIIGDIVLNSDSVGVTAIFIAIEFDNTELFAIGANELLNVPLPGMGNSFSPITPGTSINNGTGVIQAFDTVASAGQPGLLGVDGPRTLGSIVFHVISPSGSAGEEDAIVALINPANDVIGINATARCLPEGLEPGPENCDFIGADVLPEPATAALAAVSLTTLLALKRRRA